jgi:hypothetical protein
MRAPDAPNERATSNLYLVGLVALKTPVAENGPMAVGTALVEFEEALPINSMATNSRVFQAAEKVFREARHLPRSEIGVRETFLSRPIWNRIELEGREPDGEWDGVKVWLSAA